jgi:ATP-dependent DNA helicase RecG
MFTYPITLEAGPGPLLAFVPEADPGALAEAAVALANADGGTIVVGLTANGWPAPALPDGESVRAALHEAAALCDPAIRWGDPAPLDSAHGPLIAVSVPRSDYVHALADGRVLVRADGSNRRLDGRAIKALVSDQATGSFETAVVPGAARDDLDLDAIRDFAARAPLPDADPLAALDATTPDGGVTVAGLLLFGRDPQRWLPYSRVQFTRVIAGHKALPPHTLTGTLPVLPC